MKKIFIKRIAYVVLFCFVFLLIGDSYPLQASSEQDGIALIEKGEAEYIEELYLAALGSFSRAMVMVQETNNRERLKAEKEKNQAEKKETAPVVTRETTKTEVAQPIVQEKEKPAMQIEKKKKFPLLLVILGIGVVSGLVWSL